MRKILKSMVAGALTAVMTCSMCTGLVIHTANVKAAECLVSGGAVKTDVSFDGTWDGNYDNYNETAENNNRVVFRPKQEEKVTLSKRMYLEADVAIPAELIAKITKDSTYIELNSWLDFATNTLTEQQGWYDESNNVSGTDAFCSNTSIHSATTYNLWQSVDGSESVEDYNLGKYRNYYVAHVKSALEVPDGMTNVDTTELVYNFEVKAVNIKYSGYVIFDNLKLTDTEGKEIADMDFTADEDENIYNIDAYQGDSSVYTNLVNFNSAVTTFNNTVQTNLSLDEKYISNNTDNESWRNTRITEHLLEAKQFFTSGVKMKAGNYTGTANLYFPKSELDKATIKNSLSVTANAAAFEKINVYEDGWKDLDWDSVENMNSLGETHIKRDASGKLVYSYVSWDNSGENWAETEAATLPSYGDYYVLPVKNNLSLEDTKTYKGLNLTLSIIGDGCSYDGDILSDDFKLCCSGVEFMNVDFDTDAQRYFWAGKANSDKAYKNDQGLIDGYESSDIDYSYYAMDVTSASLKMSKTSATIYTGKEVKITSTVTGPSSNVKFQIGNEKVAKIVANNSGFAFVKGVKKGTTYLYATANGVTAKCKITVKAPSLTLKSSSAKIKAGKKVTIKATATPSAKITYTSKNKKIATVTSKGVVKGIKKGTTTIAVKANGITKTFKVIVK